MKPNHGSSIALMEIRIATVWVWFFALKEEKGKRRNTDEKRRATV